MRVIDGDVSATSCILNRAAVSGPFLRREQEFSSLEGKHCLVPLQPAVEWRIFWSVC